MSAELLAIERQEQRSRGPIAWAEMGVLPDRLIRAGIRHLNRQRLEEIVADDLELSSELLNAFAERLRNAPIAPLPDLANRQHYELPPEFFQEVLGHHLKYSCGYWRTSTSSLDDAEAEALRLTCEHAGIEDGMDVLDLGCGWGSLSLWIAANYPNCRVTSISNSRSQREQILTEAWARNLANISVLTRDMNDFNSLERFDRIVSIEMFEHMRNYPELFRRISTWLKARGRFFMHIFCHRSSPYEFEDNGPNDWMSRYFFSGGMMPSDDLPGRFQQDLTLAAQWRWDGRHYERTANAWLANLDARKDRVMPLLAATYGEFQADKWFMRWRMFFMACAELFGHRNGQEWYVSHYLFERAEDARAVSSGVDCSRRSGV